MVKHFESVIKAAYIGIDFLDEALKTLIENKNVELLKIFVCKTDNKTEFNTEVISLAESNNIEWTDNRITESDILNLKSIGCNVLVCAGYYHKIPVSGELPIVNVHPSFLPTGRGAWPMPVTILKGLESSGVTLHIMTDKMDEGNIILQEEFKVEKDENLKTFCNKQSVIIRKLINKLFEDFYTYYDNAFEQPSENAEYWSNPTEKDWMVTPDMPDEKIDRILRAFYGYECVWQENDCKYELIDGVLLKNKSDIPQNQRYFVTSGGSYITAPRIKILGEPITLDMREKVNALRKISNNYSSAWAFQSLYIWRNAMKLRIVLKEDFATVNCLCRGDNVWFFPIGEESACIDFIKEHKDEKGFSLIYADDSQISMLKKYFQNEFEYLRSEGDDEYIYDIKGHMTLSGKPYASVRTQLHKADREHRVVLKPLDASNLQDAVKITDLCTHSENSWFDSNNAIQTLLSEHKEIDTEIYLTYVDDVLCGVIGGFAINSEMFDVCVAQESIRFSGVSYSAKHKFFELLNEKYKYVNFEEDLNIKGLRFMKKSLAPVKMIEFWNVRKV